MRREERSMGYEFYIAGFCRKTGCYGRQRNVYGMRFRDHLRIRL